MELIAGIKTEITATHIAEMITKIIAGIIVSSGSYSGNYKKGIPGITLKNIAGICGNYGGNDN